MYYNTIKDFISDWKFESNATTKVLNSITDESLTVQINPSSRTLGFVAWHIVTTISEMCSKVGMSFALIDENSDNPNFANLIKEAYEKNSTSLIAQINKMWKDENLKEEVNMYGEMWTKGTALEALVKHQIHHRGQLTVFMRLAGLKVPGIYGPSKEEWSSMNMQPPK